MIPVSFLADFLLWFTIPGVSPARPQLQKTTDLATLRESIRAFDRKDIGHLLEHRHFRVHSLGDFLRPTGLLMEGVRLGIAELSSDNQREKTVNRPAFSSNKDRQRRNLTRYS
jgi:hypothetical protein